MIITCDQCGTRYKLDEAKVNKPKFKVKCRKCSHIFTAEKKSTGEDQPVLLQNEVVEEKPPKPPCKVIAICNQKGGVSKTTTCLNLGASLGLLNKKVLLVDFDVQSNLSVLLGCSQAKSFFDVLHSESGDIREYILRTKQNFWVLPSNDKMSLLAKKHIADERFEYLLQEKLEKIQEFFDYILIDTPPSGDFYTLNALLAADMAIVPTQAEYLSMRGLRHVETMVKVIADRNTRKIDLRVLVTMLNRKSMVAKVILRKINSRYANRVLQTKIEYDSAVQESQVMHLPTLFYDKTSQAGRQYYALAKELLSL